MVYYIKKKEILLIEEVIVLRIDEIVEKIEINPNGTFIHIEKEVLEEWIDELRERVDGE